MDIETFTTINEVTYRAIMMLIQGITLIVGLASVMFLLTAMICAVCDCLSKMGESVVRPMKQATDAHGYEKSGMPNGSNAKQLIFNQQGSMSHPSDVL